MEKEHYFSRLNTHLQKIVSLSNVDLEYIKSHVSVKYIAKKEYLIQPFQRCIHESYIVSGLFQTAIIDDSGKEFVLYFPHEDWWAGDFKSFSMGQGSTLEIQALEDSVLLQITREDLEKLYHKIPAFERFFRIMNGRAAIALQDRLVQHFSTNADKKILDFYKKYPRLQGRLSNKRVAAYLGVTPEYFSKTLKKI
ncbi:MAG TPA: Crp/Fnr family transcriptional regulator [Sphingobacteriaceae bacterium]